MNWVFICCTILIAVIVFALSCAYVALTREDLGLKNLIATRKPFGKTAPMAYYKKQALFRKCYGFFEGLHFFLMIMSISLTTITIYMVMDTGMNKTVKIVTSVMAAIFTTLHSLLQFNHIAEGCIMAARVLEQGILLYEQERETTLNVLLEANQKAERIMHYYFQ